PAFWTTLVLACGLGAAALVRLPSAWRSFTSRTIWNTLLGVWTAAAVALTLVALARPAWFWQFADPWSGMRNAPAASWVESLALRPALVIVCGSLGLVFIGLSGNADGDSSSRTRWLRLLAIVVTLFGSIALGTIAYRPNLFFQMSEPWLAWLVAGGIG